MIDPATRDPPPGTSGDPERRVTGDALKRTLIDVWDRFAAEYDGVVGHGLLREDEERAWRRLMGAILGDPRHARVPVRRVLDLGTGTGFLALLAAELGHEVCALDLSEEMLQRAAKKARDLHLVVEFHLGDAEAPPFTPRSFDVVISRHLLWTLPDPETAVQRWAELLAPGGFVAVIDGFRPPNPIRGAVARLVGRWARLAGRLRAPIRTHDYSPEQYAALPLARQDDPRAAERLLRGAGLERLATRLLREVDAAEANHRGPLERLGQPYRHYLATGHRPAT